MTIDKDIKILEKKIEIVFKKKTLLKEALTHRSYLNENLSWKLSHNERLEYLGDAVLELVVSSFLYLKYPKYQEGQLTSLRAALVNSHMLASVSREIGLEDFIFLSRGEAKDAGRAREAIMANTLEALIGAIYIDQGYEKAKSFIIKFVLKHLKEVVEEGLFIDAKSSLQEIVQEKFKMTPTYKVLEEKGPDHRKSFLVGVYFGAQLTAKGKGMSKQEAEREAAHNALLALKKK